MLGYFYKNFPIYHLAKIGISAKVVEIKNKRRRHMLKKLTIDHEEDMIALLSKEKELNLFIIGDLENYGFDASFLEYWGQFQDEQLVGVLMRYHEGFSLYVDQGITVNTNGVLEIMKPYNPDTLCAGKRILDQFESVITYGNRKDMYFAKLDHPNKLVNNNLVNQVCSTTIEELPELQVLLEERIEEFTNSESLERKRENYKEGVRRGYHLKDEHNKMIATAETAAENSQSAMVIAVATLPEYRQKGYATAVMSKLCGDLLKENKSLCLFYNNPKAGEVYKRIGFEDIDIWGVWQLKGEKN